MDDSNREPTEQKVKHKKLQLFCNSKLTLLNWWKHKKTLANQKNGEGLRFQDGFVEKSSLVKVVKRWK